jgi:hypothetical protein
MMLRALQSFTSEYDGRTVAVHRGKTRVASDHELAQRYPQRFEPVPEHEQLRYRGACYRMGGDSITDWVRALPPVRDNGSTER